ncbi:hypothetical protein P692DRAFT_20227125 [Suillus brevipes Sb2]|nr:hypothetical protein P692DRAFT_20227125 [Suillus brevipes Sb2]
MVASLVGWVEHQRDATLIKHELLVSDDCNGCIGEPSKRHIQIHSHTTPRSATGRAYHKSLLIIRILDELDSRFGWCAGESRCGTLLQL